MSLRFVFAVVACGLALALAHNVDRLHEHKTKSSVGTDPISLLPQSADSAVHSVQHKSLHRRQSPETAVDGVVCETGAYTPDKIAADISHDTGSLHSNKRSLDDVQPGNVAEPGCCG